ncbi:MAG TPA: hypothetical protein V6C65_16135 [Allocoleopsis sp.]
MPKPTSLMGLHGLELHGLERVAYFKGMEQNTVFAILAFFVKSGMLSSLKYSSLKYSSLGYPVGVLSMAFASVIEGER